MGFEFNSKDKRKREFIAFKTDKCLRDLIELNASSLGYSISEFIRLSILKSCIQKTIKEVTTHEKHKKSKLN
jgi:hypothetical protein